MLRFGIFGACALALSACDPIAVLQKAQNTDLPEVSCFTRPEGGCSFDQDPLRVEPKPVTIQRRPYKFFPTAATMNFVDSQGRNWVAPRGTLTDGASIPEIFTTIVGKPTSPEYVNAAAVHDAYCGIGNEAGTRWHDGRWEDVHRMFYDGLIVGGTPEFRAKLMYAAVWLGGPRWEITNRWDEVDTAELQTAMRATKSYISTSKPTLPQLDAYLRKWEFHLLTTIPRLEDNPSEAVEEPHDYFEEPYEPYDPYDPYDPVDPGCGTACQI
ncbi:DUF1353 domain-containing protein [uncultured Pelagimonas sp.]|uniref:DUF1353 domain-containing protein n=1 Tax=uncultured Pelagimonas sp. TaxID=1618102 RepID=UPI00262EAF9C|nr:DUF1353 domain-containing protein [uncultured Pelagimonas sp.]